MRLAWSTCSSFEGEARDEGEGKGAGLAAAPKAGEGHDRRAQWWGARTGVKRQRWWARGTRRIRWIHRRTCEVVWCGGGSRGLHLARTAMVCGRLYQSGSGNSTSTRRWLEPHLNDSDSHPDLAFAPYPSDTASYRPPVPLFNPRACFGGRGLGGAERSVTWFFTRSGD